MEVKCLEAAALARLAVAVTQAAKSAGATQYATSEGEHGTVDELDADGSALTRLGGLQVLELAGPGGWYASLSDYGDGIDCLLPARLWASVAALADESGSVRYSVEEAVGRPEPLLRENHG
jgi:hypothetical protein